MVKKYDYFSFKSIFKFDPHQRLGSFKRLGLPRGKHFETSYHYHVDSVSDLTRYHVVLISEDFSLQTELVRARALPSLSDSGLVTGQSTLHTVLTACRDMSGHVGTFCPQY